LVAALNLLEKALPKTLFRKKSAKKPFNKSFTKNSFSKKALFGYFTQDIQIKLNTFFLI